MHVKPIQQQRIEELVAAIKSLQPQEGKGDRLLYSGEVLEKIKAVRRELEGKRGR